VQPIQKVIESYNLSEGVSAKVRKTIKLSLLDDTKISTGKMFFEKGKVRLEINEPEKSIMVVGSGVIWLETEIEGFDGVKKHVTKIQSRDLGRQMRAPLAALFGRKKAWEEFKVDSKKNEGDITYFVLSPKNAKGVEIKSMLVGVDEKKNIIRKVSYKDEIENEVIYEFENVKLNEKVSESKFDYQPPKGAEVVSF
jgi:outer membrane lipoprotein carrier protein